MLEHIIIYIKLFLYYLLAVNIGIAPSIAPNRFLLKNNDLIPYASNIRINTKSDSIQYAVIVVHGILKDSDNAYSLLLGDINQLHIPPNNAIIIAPQFLTENDITNNHLTGNIATWAFESWDSGDYATSKTSKELSSFTVIDEMLLSLSRNFPNLKYIDVIGFSAGGQFIQRYAALDNFPQQLLLKNKIKLSYMVVSPSSYLYLDGVRNQHHDISKLEQLCKNYNDYKYGIEDINKYFKHSFLPTNYNEYAEKNIYYIIGNNDNHQDLYLDKSCQAMIQGQNRVQRATNFYTYLINKFGQAVTNNQHLILINDNQHQMKTMFSSKEFINIVSKTFH